MIDVRRLIEEDAALYWNLRLEAVEREPRSFGVTPEEHRLTTIEETAASIRRSDSFFVGAFEGAALVGIARLDRESAEKEHHKGHLRRVYVTSSHRERGIAKALIAFIIAELQDDSTIEQLLLCVGTFNQGARAVYIRMGFTSFGIEPRALKAGEEYIDEEHMILRLR